MKSIVARSWLVIVLLSFPTALLAQARLTGADLDGTVRDETGAPMPGTTVTVINVSTNVTRTAVTDDAGRYYVPALSPGTYTVSAELQGFAPAKREGLALQLGQSASADLTLKLTVEESVVVTASAAEVGLVDVHDASVSAVVGRQQIEALPINGRNFVNFAIITPGVNVDNTPQQGASQTSGLSFAGQRARSNNVMVDGLDNNDASLGAVRAVFSQEAIQEFQVLTNSYSAEFGKASGGVLNIITKSGTNELRGNVFAYFRDRELNSNAHFEENNPDGSRAGFPKSPFRQWQYGATLGGPLIRDRTFYFLSSERLDAEDGNIVTVSPSAVAALTAAGFPVARGANGFDVRQSQLLAKVDHQWGPSASAVFRVNYSDITNENIEPFGGLTARSRGAERLVEDYSASLSQSNFRDRWVNEARFQFARQDQKIYSLDPACGGRCTGFDQGGPTVEIAGVANAGRQRFTPQLRESDRLQALDTYSYFWGNHQLKAGVEYNHISSDDALPLHFGGRFIFTSLAAFQAGTPAAYVQGYGNPEASYDYQDASAFLQDAWRVSDRLTLNAGVRYQRQWFPDLRYDVSAPGGTRYRYGFPDDGNNVAPRLSLSWDPKGDGRRAVHASWGLFYDNMLTGITFITDSIDGTAGGVRTLVAGGAVAQAAWNAPGHRLTEAQALALLGGSYPSLVIAIDPELETPYAQQAALGYEQALGADYAVSASLLWVHGEHQLGTIDYNPRMPSLGHPAARPNDLPGRPGSSASVLQYTSFGETWYKGLTLTLQKRYSHGNQFLVSYTLAESEDNSTDFQSAFVPQNMGFGRNPADPSGPPLGGALRCVGSNCQLPFDPDDERGPAVWDQRHRVVVSGLYTLPGAVRLSAIGTYATGRPFTPLIGADANADGNGGATPPDRARTNPADVTTSVGRNSERLPSTYTVDLRVSRTFHLTERVSFEPVFEVFNLFDRTNYTDVNNIFGPGAYPSNPLPTYGQFTAAAPPRQIQLAAKVSF